jgi:hypothetical protein
VLFWQYVEIEYGLLDVYYESLFRNVSMSAFLVAAVLSKRFPPNFDALNPNLKAVFQNST